MGCCSNGHSHKGHNHHHHHHHDSCCCHEPCSCCCCCAEEVCESEEHDECCNGEKLLEIADMAWVEVLKEKIKEHIRANNPKMDELAKVVSEANHKRWKHRMEKQKCCSEAEQCCSDYQDQLCKLMSSCGTDSCKTNGKK